MLLVLGTGRRTALPSSLTSQSASSLGNENETDRPRQASPCVCCRREGCQTIAQRTGIGRQAPNRENSEKAFNALAYTCFAVLAKTSPDPASEAKAFAKQLPTMLTRMSALFHRGPKH